MAETNNPAQAVGYGLSDEQLATLLSEGLKPEEIGGSAELQHARVGELVSWFARLARKQANPKWAVSHAYELAYFVATNAGNRHIDLKPIREAAYKEGAMVSPSDRAMLERIGFLEPLPAAPLGPAAEGTEAVGEVYERPEGGLGVKMRKGLKPDEFPPGTKLYASAPPLSAAIVPPRPLAIAQGLIAHAASVGGAAATHMLLAAATIKAMAVATGETVPHG